MTYKDTETLIQKYLNGETTAEEERLLAVEVSREEAPADWKVIAEMLGRLTVDEALFDQIMAERKPRVVRLWPWVAAACVAALLIVFLGPPKEDAVTQPPIAKVVPNVKAAEAEPTETKERERKEEPTPTLPRGGSAKSLERPVRQGLKKKVSKRIIKEEKEPVTEKSTLRPVEEGDIAPYEDPMMQFAEQTRALRERGNRVIHRVSMNSIPSDNYPLTDL